MAEVPRKVHFWKDDESVLMLTLLKELNILKYVDGRKTRNGDLFKKVAEQMKEGGFTQTPEQICIRWKHLKKTYYQARKNNSTIGHNQVTCPFGNALEELLGPRPLSQVDHHGVDIGFESPLDTSVQEAGGLDEMEEMATEAADGSEETETDTASRPQTLHLLRPSGRRRHVANIDTVLERIQATWMQ
ncbi:zinc finger protein with KRAB and SCAN domains 2-like [Epinephelus fuscoguttatus]|uniref:zinc finger protein with KRAB and SCAN domains 2-like n=1 Tax=Epinephelus fuscoguttatus TaxID=293821 RepID=UPI0020CFF546|nr:zinc finger protein with KRAB and SCAN domains 2-like [Epinephelus fuscoguttatus]